MKKGSIAKLCGIYTPAVTATLDFLQSEMQKRKKARQTAKPYRKNSITKITYNDIDTIMAVTFGTTPRYMGEIRQCYFNPEKREIIRPRRPGSWYFNANQLKTECAKLQIDISQKIDQIQRLYISTLTVAEVLSKDDSFITANIKSQIKQDIQALSSVLETNYGTQYWDVVLKYLPQCVSHPPAKDLVVLLPQCKIDFIDNWIRQLENISSPHNRKKRVSLEQMYSFLQDFSEELFALDKIQVTTTCAWEEVFCSFTRGEFPLIMLEYEFLFSAISEHKLRANDVILAYLVETQISHEYKEIFYDALADELNLDGNVAF